MSWLIGLSTIAALVALVPLCVWGATGSASRALDALREYGTILGAFVAVGGGLALLVTLVRLIESR